MSKMPNTRTVDQLEAAVAEVANFNTRGLDEAPRPAQSSADAIAAHGNAIIDRSTQEALDGLRALRKQIDEAERMLLDNAARIQSEIKSHINMTALAGSAFGVIAGQIAEHRADHAAIVSAVTVNRAA
jgi:hypothetical protein